MISQCMKWLCTLAEKVEEASLIKCKILVIHHWFSRTVHLTKLPVIFKSKELSCSFFFLCSLSSLSCHFFWKGRREPKLCYNFLLFTLCTVRASGNPKCITLGKHRKKWAVLAWLFFLWTGRRAPVGCGAVRAGKFRRPLLSKVGLLIDWLGGRSPLGPTGRPHISRTFWNRAMLPHQSN